MYQTSPSQEDCYTGVRAFLLTILPAGTEVVVGQVNRVPQPEGENHVVIWPLLRDRLGTNLRSDGDVKYIGSIDDKVLTVTDAQAGQIVVGNFVFGVDVAEGTRVTDILTGVGGIGTYSVNNSQTVGSRVLSSGAVGLVQKTDLIFQIDSHGPSSPEFAQMISTFFRDTYSIEWLKENGYPVVPLYTEEPRQRPFNNAENQVEEKWSVDVHFQVDVLVSAPQQYADAVAVDLINVDAVYPP